MNIVAHKRRHPDTPDYPEIDAFTRDEMDRYLRYFLVVAENTYKRMRRIPKDERDEWYDNNVRYWKNVAAGFRWAVKRNLTTMVRDGVEPSSST